MLDEIEGKAIIWAHYQHDVKNIFKLLEDKYGPGSVVHYYGKTLPEERDYAIKNFKTMISKILCRHTTDRWLWYHVSAG